jgi:hypothetical protein
MEMTMSQEPERLAYDTGRIRRWAERQQDILSRCQPWTPDLCPPGTDCKGLYEVPHPDGEGMRTFGCERHGTASCERAGDFDALDVEWWMARCGLGPLYRNPQADKLRARAAIDGYCDNLAANLAQGIGLLLTGSAGSGKTFSLVYIVARARELSPRPDVRFVFSGELFDHLHSDAGAVEQYAAYDLLLLDDWGREHQGTWNFARFESLVEARHARMKSTCITTNLTAAQLRGNETWVRIIDRWREKCLIVPVEGETQRETQGEPA